MVGWSRQESVARRRGVQSCLGFEAAEAPSTVLVLPAFCSQTSCRGKQNHPTSAALGSEMAVLGRELSSVPTSRAQEDVFLSFGRNVLPRDGWAMRPERRRSCPDGTVSSATRRFLYNKVPQHISSQDYEPGKARVCPPGTLLGWPIAFIFQIRNLRLKEAKTLPSVTPGSQAFVCPLHMARHPTSGDVYFRGACFSQVHRIK